MVMNLDNEQFEQRKSAMRVDFASLGKMVVTDLKRANILHKIIYKHKKEEFLRFVDNQELFQKQLRDISIYMYNRSSHFKRLVDYMATLPLYSYVLEPINIDRTKVNKAKILKQYNKINSLLENMNISHEFIKVLMTAWREDVFYGFIHSTPDSFFIQALDPDFCRITSAEDGVFNYAFNFAYFDMYYDRLLFFPPYFNELYQTIYKKNISVSPWIELPADRTICIKVNEDYPYPVLPFLGVFDAIYDIQDFKALRKTRVEIGNYKVLVQELPIRTDSDQNNDFMIDWQNMMLFHNKASEALPQHVSLITSPMKIHDINFQRDTIDQDNVAASERDFWSASGVSQLLFNAEKAGSIGLDKSIKSDENLAFAVLRQVERWINRYLKFNFDTLNFKIRFLNITEYNKQEVFDRAVSAGALGVPVRQIIGATFGYTPSTLSNMAWLENEILDLDTDFVPMQSAHVQSGANDGNGNPADSKAKGGRPTQGDKIGEEALRTRDKKGN